MLALLTAHVGWTPACAGIVLTTEDPGVQTSTVPGVITETFNDFSTGQYSTLTTAVGALSTNGALSIVAADIYGGAGGTGNYFAVGAQSNSAEPVTLTFSGPQSYFGLWWSAGDVNNTLTFYSGANVLASYTTATALGGLPGSYFGNPNNGGDTGEPFAYLNFNGTSGTTFTSVVFSNNGTTGTGFEADNFSIQSVPEPSSLVLSGTAATIGALVLWRRRRQANGAAQPDLA